MEDPIIELYWDGEEVVCSEVWVNFYERVAIRSLKTALTHCLNMQHALPTDD
jgi:hypothetical protein